MADLNSNEIMDIERRHGSGLWNVDIAIVRGEGSTIWDSDGRSYIDCMAGIAVASLGYGHPRLLQAISEQAERLMVCTQNLGNDTRAAFLEKLFAIVGPSLSRAFLCNSGSEANEGALKWARVATGRSKFVATKRGFSGRTLGVLGLTWEKAYREPFGPLGYEAEFVPYNDIEALGEAITEDVAAVVLEPIQGEGGIHPADNDYLQEAQRLCREHGTLLVADEIQCGVGRSGSFLALEPSGIQPDIVTLAKGLGGGFPIGAVLMTDEVAKTMPVGGHGGTFGGNPLACSAALAVLNEIVESDLLDHVRRVGQQLSEGLRSINSDKIRTVRGRGLMIGLQLKIKVAEVISKLREHGVFAMNAGSTVIRFVPPLTITEAEVDQVIEAVTAVLSE